MPTFRIFRLPKKRTMTTLTLDETLRTFLEKPLIARMSTLDRKGYPHTVPVWYMLDGSDFMIIGTRETRKVGHILANPKGSLQVGGEPGNGGGYLIKGHFSIEEDPGYIWMKKLIYRYETGEQAKKDVADWSDLDMIVMRLRPEIMIKV
jgi:predicted pyridoxine 5'-phosphate oxidase superfamily flavin-nucleotide-binding protein